VIEAGGTRASFDRDRGALHELAVDGRNVLAAGPLLQLWRAPTDNDGLRLVEEKRDFDVLPRWLELGLDRLELETRSLKVGGSSVEIVHHARGIATHTHSYRLLDTGELVVDNVVELARGVSDIPRIGVRLTLVPGLDQLTWYGRGPWESYSDRLTSAVAGRYESTVAEEYVPYIVPQEHGLHTDTRWLTLSGDGFGLRVDGRPTIGFSASHFTAADLYGALHTSDLTPREETFLSLDHAQRGLGTASCGPDTGEQYRLLDRVYRFSYVLRPYRRARRRTRNQ
jgi:beta-galactosidase